MKLFHIKKNYRIHTLLCRKREKNKFIKSQAHKLIYLINLLIVKNLVNCKYINLIQMKTQKIQNKICDINAKFYSKIWYFLSSYICNIYDV
jgi:hypothetical protein